MSRITKGMILAAGLGTRMRPITDKIPKALIELNGLKLIDYSLQILNELGIEEVVINLHHLGDMIRDYLGKEKFGMKISYSEEVEILGTGGGIKKGASLLGADEMIAINCDVIFKGLEVKKIVQEYDKTKAPMLILKKNSSDTYTKISSENGFVTKFGSGDFVFTGLQIVTKDLIDTLPPLEMPSCIINNGYKKMLYNGRKIKAYEHEGLWLDIGTLENYERARGKKL